MKIVGNGIAKLSSSEVQDLIIAERRRRMKTLPQMYDELVEENERLRALEKQRIFANEELCKEIERLRNGIKSAVDRLDTKHWYQVYNVKYELRKLI